MAQTEKIQFGTPLSHPQPATPPGSPNLLPFEHISLDNVPHFTKMVDDTVDRTITSVINHFRLKAKLDEAQDVEAHRHAIVEPPKAVGQVARLNEYVFVIRRHVDKKTNKTTYYVDIESEPLQGILRDVLKDISCIRLYKSKLSVDQNLLYTTLPKLELCYSWNEIAPLDQLGTEHLGLLISYIKIAYVDTTRSLLSLLSTGCITYDLLWALFSPNVLVYTTCSRTHKPRCVKYNFGKEKTTKIGAKYWSMDCCYLDFNGEELRSVAIELKISKFRGARRIKTLGAFPLQYHANVTRVQTELLRCGRKFMHLRGTYHCHCNGRAFYKRDGESVEVRIDSRIMVDAALFRQMNPNYFQSTDLDMGDVYDLREVAQPLYNISADDASKAFLGAALGITSSKPASAIFFDHAEGSVVEEAKMLENLLICCPTVPGFSLKDNLWAEFAVADIEEIMWSLAPFDGLILPYKQRETLMALVDKELDFRFNDVVKDKERGTVILLHGNPGVGKTLTVEAVAEHRRNPLYSISIGELSTNASQLENQLFKIFQIVKYWDAILLIDEADVFLEQRATHDRVRNSLVSIFLHKMEYCQGLMFLTANRVSLFDPAAVSRIHLKLKYDDLKIGARRAVWEDFLNRVITCYGPADISSDNLEILSEIQLNYQEIKNIVSIACKIAIMQGSRVTFSHLIQVSATCKDFMDDFNGTEYVRSL